MINTYIISGFLGSGKTTFIKYLLNNDKFANSMLIENEFGEASVDDKLFDEGLKIKAINSGCICCSLKGDLEKALDEIATYDIETLLIEPSGVGKLTEIIASIKNHEDFKLKSHITMVDAKKAKSYHKNYKEFFDDQVIAANSIILTKTDLCDEEKVSNTTNLIKELNDEATVVVTPYSELEFDYLIKVIEDGICECEFCDGCINEDELLETVNKHHHEHHHEECDCGHHHDDCECGHHHHHHADDVFESLGFETNKIVSKDELNEFLNILKNDDNVVRAKGFLRSENTWLYFDLSGEDIFVKEGSAKINGLVTIIGKDIHKYEGMFK